MRITHGVITITVLLSAACAGRKAVWTEDPANGESPSPQAVGAPVGNAADQAIAEGDAHWAKRTDADSIRAAITAWERANEAAPGSLELLVKLTRAHYFLADGYLRANDQEYLRVMNLGVKWGERAMLASSPEFAQQMREGAKLPAAVKSVPKSGVPALYWYASALGKWAKRTGFAVLVGQKDNVKATMDRCLELDPNYYYGGPHRYFGAYYAVAPAFAGGDLEKSKIHFKKSLEIEPQYVGTKVLWAQELAVKLQDEETFDRLLNEVLQASDDAIPEIAPEIGVEKGKARELLEEKSDLF